MSNGNEPKQAAAESGSGTTARGPGRAPALVPGQGPAQVTGKPGRADQSWRAAGWAVTSAVWSVTERLLIRHH